MTQKQLKRLYQEELKKITQSLIKGYKPEKIILFGSAANEKWHKNSDIDLLVIKSTNDNYWDRQKKALSFYKGWRPVDIFVLTPDEIREARKTNRFFLTEEILAKGKVVYEK